VRIDAEIYLEFLDLKKLIGTSSILLLHLEENNYI
jgi:hypothetical protein